MCYTPSIAQEMEDRKSRYIGGRSKMESRRDVLDLLMYSHQARQIIKIGQKLSDSENVKMKVNAKVQCESLHLPVPYHRSSPLIRNSGTALHLEGQPLLDDKFVVALTDKAPCFGDIHSSLYHSSHRFSVFTRHCQTLADPCSILANGISRILNHVTHTQYLCCNAYCCNA